MILTLIERPDNLHQVCSL